jgi:hypothetical protein
VPDVSPLLVIGAAGAAGLLVVAARRPALACALLALAIPLTAGMERGVALPVLRVNEALLLVVAAGVAAHWLVRRRPLTFTGLDVAVLAFCLVGAVVPWAVIELSHADAELRDWLVVLGPVQYLLMYVVFSRTEFGGADLRRLLDLCMLASIPIAAVAIAELLDLGGARNLVSTLYPTAPMPSWDTVYRPPSLLGHYSALGAFGLLNFLLALALAATRHPGFSQRWLTVVMGVNLLSLIVSQTFAPAVGLALGAAAVIVAARRFPWPQAAAAPPALAVAALVFWPSISGRVAAQLSGPGGTALPESMQTRIEYWQDFFVPALLRHGPWLGTGTLMPPEVPRPLVEFVDNGYLWQLFRAGVPGLVVLLTMLGTVAAVGWAARRSDDPTHRAVGLTCVGAVVGVVLMDVTSEYLTFTAVSQEFWMLVGLLGGFAGAWRRPASVLPVESGPSPGARAGPRAGSSDRRRRGAALVGRLRGFAGAWRRPASVLPVEPGPSPGARRDGAVPVHVVVAARVARLARDWKGLPRRVVWRHRPGYRSQRTSTVPIVPVATPERAPGPASPSTTAVGVVEPSGGRSPVAAAARLLGLAPETAGPHGIQHLLDRALLERWEVVATPAESLAGPGRGLGSLAAYVGRGGTLYLDGLDERSNEVLSRLPVPLPPARRLPGGGRLLLPARQAAFAGPLAGTAVETACGEHVLEWSDPRDVLAWGVTGGGRRAVVMQRCLGRGRIVVSTLPRPAPAARLVEVLESDRAGSLVVALLLLRQRYGLAAWHAPLPVANFTIDDPALRQGLLGLRYDLLAAQARDHRFHVTIATVPLELPLAEERALRELRQHPELLSACYHGCDHDGYEFPRTAGVRTAYAPRPLPEQRAALRRAVERGLRFARERAYRLDRVMVFPYGVGPARLLPELRRLGFLATCNYWDKYPLEAPVPAEPELGLRPADLAWEGFPLLWRRSMLDEGCLLDLLLGRPLLHFAHRADIGRDFLPFLERARTINRASGDAVAWCGLEAVARHAYLQRRRPGVGWEVLMTADEACLHNPDPVPRTCAVTRPRLPDGSQLRARGSAGRGPLRVMVPAGGTALVPVVDGEPAPPLSVRAGSCSLFGEGRA